MNENDCAPTLLPPQQKEIPFTRRTELTHLALEVVALMECKNIRGAEACYFGHLCQTIGGW